MQPRENIKPRAALHQSAPSAIAQAMSKALAILPETPMRMRSRASMPTSALRTKTRSGYKPPPTALEKASKARRSLAAGLHRRDLDQDEHDPPSRLGAARSQARR